MRKNYREGTELRILAQDVCCYIDGNAIISKKRRSGAIIVLQEEQLAERGEKSFDEGGKGRERRRGGGKSRGWSEKRDNERTATQ